MKQILLNLFSSFEYFCIKSGSLMRLMLEIDASTSIQYMQKVHICPEEKSPDLLSEFNAPHAPAVLL